MNSETTPDAGTCTSEPHGSAVLGRSLSMPLTRWWLKTRPCSRGEQLNHDGTPPCIEFYVPWWAWPLELAHCAIFGRARLLPNAAVHQPLGAASARLQAVWCDDLFGTDLTV
jgi:hypothetical protein